MINSKINIGGNVSGDSNVGVFNNAIINKQNSQGLDNVRLLMRESDAWLRSHSISDQGYANVSIINSALKNGDEANARKYILDNIRDFSIAFASNVASAALWEAISKFIGF